MMRGLVLGRSAGALALLAMSGFAVPPDTGDRPPIRSVQDAPVQNQPAPNEPLPNEPGEPPVEGAVPDEALPPPILPAPDVPIDDPLVELPPAGESPPAVATSPGGVPVTPGGTPFSFADLAQQLLDSVVYISTAQRVAISRDRPRPTPRDNPSPPTDEFFEDFFDDNNEGGGSPRSVQSLGSGFVIDASGLIVTNNHVIADADEITANLGDGRKFTAEVIGVDDKTDLALLKVNAPVPLKAVRFGRSEALRVGDWVLAIGNPFGFGGTVTAGIVSALDRDINSGPYDHYIQTDASINRGNSGGPLFNIGGEVVGINTAIMSPTGGSIGIGFSVPTEIAIPVIEQLREFGEVRRGWIGVRIQDVSEDIAEDSGENRATGALIAGLSDDGPADKAGIQAGDIVVEFNGKPVESMRALPRLVADTPPGETVEVIVLRDGERVTLALEIGLLEEEQVAAATTEEPEAGENGEPTVETAGAMFGLELGAITDEARQTYSIESSVEGVLVTRVEAGSEAEKKSLKPGEVIVQVSTRPVTDPDQVSARLAELKKEGRRTVMLLVSGADKKLRFVSLRFEDAP
jgi:serine protease Do